MNVLTNAPIEVPRLKEKEETTHSLPGIAKNLTLNLSGESEKLKNLRPIIDADINVIDNKVVVNLSGKKNIKAATNWMTKHMEAYPETYKGFYIRFGHAKLGYLVKTCKKNEKDSIKINGNYYKLYPHEFIDNKEAEEKIDTIIDDTKEGIIKALREGEDIIDNSKENTKEGIIDLLKGMEDKIHSIMDGTKEGIIKVLREREDKINLNSYRKKNE